MTQRGFTILDTMVATLVMIIGTVGLLSMQLTQVSAGLRSRQLTEAGDLSQQTMERLLLLTPGQLVLAGGQTDTVDARGCPVPAGGTVPSLGCDTPIAGTLYTRTWSATASGQNGAQVQVQVTWTDPSGQSHEVTLVNVR
jgi:Tfp pilus assembly protein PilV